MHLSAFIHQKSYEKIVLKLRKHPIITFPAILAVIFLLGLPIIVYWFFLKSFASISESELVFSIVILVGGIYYLGVGIFYYTYFINYYLDLLVVTNDRLLHIQQISIFARTISEVDLYKIQDITSSIDGFVQSMFNYGNLLIQTAGALEKFNVADIPDPEHLRQKILDLAEEDRKFHLSTGNFTPKI